MELVQIDSESGNEREICDRLHDKLSRLGLSVMEDNSASKTGLGAGNLIATLPPTQMYATPIYFTCHMDTVTPGNGVNPIIHGEYVMSDGRTVLGSDDKAGIAALLEGIRLLQEQRIEHGLIQFIITVGEEVGLIGAKHLNPALIRAEHGYALDSNGPVGEIIASCAAHMKARIKIRGRAAHSGINPEEGISAIQIASKAISKIKLGRIDHETTINIGQFHGGVAMNIVPEEATIVAEVRSCNMEKLRHYADQMVETFRQTALTHGGAVEAETDLSFASFEYTPQDAVIQHAMTALKTIGREPFLISTAGGSDANIFNSYGIPTVNLGLGYEKIHTTEERMPIQELSKAAELVVALAAQTATVKEIAVTTDRSDQLAGV